MNSSAAHTKWNANLYDDKHSFVFKYGEDLVDLLSPATGERILDLGCGTGYLTSVIAVSGASVVGIDSSFDMITKAKTAYPELDFKVQSATEFYFDEHFHAIFSNAVLHWVLQKEMAIDCIYRNLKKSGRLVLEFGGKNNVARVITALQNSLVKHGFAENASIPLWYFPSLGEYTSLLEKRGFRVTYAAHFNRDTKLADTENGIKDWIKMFGSAFLKGIESTEIDEILTETQEVLAPTQYKNGEWFADYKRLRIIATK
jgi:trans-aconitate methyltransferase